MEIKHDSPALMTANGAPERDPREHFEDSKHRLLYSIRSHVHPTGQCVQVERLARADNRTIRTAYSRDNISGYIAIVKRV